MIEPIFFADSGLFREWLVENHATQTVLLVGFYKVGTGKLSMTWSESVDQALCFGWIDGVRKSIDKESYSIRFTPRKPNSIWSNVNVDKVENLKALGLMHDKGLKAYELRSVDKSGIYSFEQDDWKFTEEMQSIFKTETTAWDFFQQQAPSYRKMAIHWIVTAKQNATQLSRLQKVIDACSAGKRLWTEYKK